MALSPPERLPLSPFEVEGPGTEGAPLIAGQPAASSSAGAWANAADAPAAAATASAPLAGPPSSMLAFTLVASLGGLLFGFDTGKRCRAAAGIAAWHGLLR